jgi:hypothetical protein
MMDSLGQATRVQCRALNQQQLRAGIPLFRAATQRIVCITVARALQQCALSDLVASERASNGIHHPASTYLASAAPASCTSLLEEHVTSTRTSTALKQNAVRISTTRRNVQPICAAGTSCLSARQEAL